MKKCYKYFITIFLLVIITNIMSADETNDNYRAIEVDIGGSITTSFVLLHTSIFLNENNSFYDRIKFGNYFLEFGIRPQGISISIGVPFSFLYYSSKNFAFGIFYSIGFETLISPGYMPPQFVLVSTQNKIKFVNKIGNGKMINWFLLEYGVNLTYSFMPVFNDQLFHDGFYFGPSLFIGYEKNLKNMFSYSIGFSFDGIFTDITNKNNYWTETKTNIYTDNYEGHVESAYDWLFLFGLEARFRFSYIKELKK